MVFAVRDRATGQRAALKTLQWPEGEEIFRLKREFRSLAGLSHPNLVRLYDLHAADGVAWFTMELVEGVGFVEHVRGPLTRRSGGPAIDQPLAPDEIDALRALTRQLIEGIDALHAAGRLHRDIKPSNVLISPEGRVVLLDFGLATPIRASAIEPEDSTRRQVVGTVAYMAPEQGWAGELGPAADWYAVGVMLYEALTGERPFPGTGLMEVLAAKEAADLRWPGERVPDTPADLDRLVRRLLDPDPTRRPDALALLAALGVSTGGLRSPRQPRATRSGPVFVGRVAERAALTTHLNAVAAGRPRLVHVHGPAGIGKSALMETFLDEAAATGAVALVGRCDPREDLPFQGLDGVVDGLSRLLLEEPARRRRALVGGLSPDLTRLFPVLRRVPDLPWPRPQTGDAADPAAARGRALEALRELLRRVAGGRPLLLWIDDLQWGDRDGSHALQALLRSPDAPPLLLAVSWPTPDEGAASVQALLPGAPGVEDGVAHRLPLDRLTAAEAETLLTSASGHRDPIPGARVPTLAAALALYEGHQPDGDAPSVEAALRAQAARCPGPARRLLDVVAMADDAIDPQIAAVAALVDDAAAAAPALLAQRLLRRTADGRLDAYRPEVRAAVRAGIADPEALQLRLQRARVTVGADAGAPGHPDPAAADRALRAAHHARQALAFDLAATLYGRALAQLSAEHSGRWALLDQQAEAQARAGRSAEAGRAWAEAAARLAATDPHHPRLAPLQRQAAEQHLRAGRISDGQAALDGVLRPVGLSLPATPQAALRRLVWDRLRLRVRGLRFKLRAGDTLPPETLRRIDACWAAAMGLCWVDSMQSAVFQCRFTLLSLAAGEPDRVARALATEAAFAANEGGEGNRRRSATVLTTARGMLPQVDDPITHAIVDICESAAAFFSARFGDAVDAADRAEISLAASGQGWTWEALNAQVFGMWSRVYRGELDALQTRLPVLLDAARERGDLLTAATLGSGAVGLAWLAQDRPEVARQRADDAMALWVHDQGFTTQHFMNVVAQVHIDLYAGDGVRAWLRVREAWPRMKRALILRLQYLRMEGTWLRGRAGVAALRQGPAALSRADLDPRSIAAQVEQDAIQLAAEDLPWGRALAAGLRAGLALVERRPDAAERLRTAIAAFDRAGLDLCREAARQRLGMVEGPDGDAAARTQAAAWMSARGVVRAAALASVLVPG